MLKKDQDFLLEQTGIVYNLEASPLDLDPHLDEARL